MLCPGLRRSGGEDLIGLIFICSTHIRGVGQQATTLPSNLDRCKHRSDIPDLDNLRSPNTVRAVRFWAGYKRAEEEFGRVRLTKINPPRNQTFVFWREFQTMNRPCVCGPTCKLLRREHRGNADAPVAGTPRNELAVARDIDAVHVVANS